jgi:hypothetical protein
MGRWMLGRFSLLLEQAEYAVFFLWLENLGTRSLSGAWVQGSDKIELLNRIN